MPISVITSKGLTTVPKKIRDHLNLHPGDRIDFVIGENGKVIIEPATLDAKELEGILSRPGKKTVTVDEMKNAVRERFRKKQ